MILWRNRKTSYYYFHCLILLTFLCNQEQIFKDLSVIINDNFSLIFLQPDITTSTRLNCLADDFLFCLVTPLSWVLVNHHARFSHLYTAHMQSVVKKRKWTQDNYFPISIFCKIAITQNLIKSVENIIDIDYILWKMKDVYGKIITPKGMIIKLK